MIDWGGVLTAPLDNVIGAWMSADGVAEEHFREVMRRWVGVRDDAPAPDDAAEGSAYDEAEAAPDRGPAGLLPAPPRLAGEQAAPPCSRPAPRPRSAHPC